MISPSAVAPPWPPRWPSSAWDAVEVKKTVESEADVAPALAEAEAAGANALVVFLGNFGPETPETLLVQKFDGPAMCGRPPRATATS